MCSFCYDIDFVVIMMFFENVINTKVVDNFLILLVLKFHDFRATGLRDIDFTNTLSGFICVLDSAAMLCLFD